MNFLNFINIYGILFTAVLVVPNVVYGKTHSHNLDIIENKAMLYIERIGKYCSLFLMSINLGILEKGFQSVLMQNFWLISVSVLLLLYIVLWIFYFKNESKIIAYALTIIPAVIFMLSGLLQIKTLLLTFGFVFLIGQSYVTSKYVK